MNKSIFLSLLFLLMLPLITIKNNVVNAINSDESSQICNAINVDQDSKGIYLVSEKLMEPVNLLPNESIYNSNIGIIKMKDAIQINNPSSGYLSLVLQFEKGYAPSDSSNINNIYSALKFDLWSSDNFSNIYSFDSKKNHIEKFTDLMSYSDEYISFKYNKFLYIYINCINFPNTFVLGKLKDKESFSFTIDSNNQYGVIKDAMLTSRKVNYIFTPNLERSTYGRYACMKKMESYVNDYQISIDITDPLSLSEILKLIHPYDKNDGELQIEILEDHYSNAIKNKSLGVFLVKLKTTNLSKSSSYLNLYISLSDNKAPLIEGPFVITLSYLNNETSESILKRFNITDNSGFVNATLNDEGVNYNKIGSYVLSIDAIDSSGNTNSHIFKVEIIDDVAPFFVGPDNYYIETSKLPNINDLLKNKIYAYDEIDKFIDFEIIYDEYSTSSKAVGNYQVTLKAVDNNGNMTTKNITIVVLNSNPIWYIDEMKLIITPHQKLSAMDVVTLLKEQRMIEDITYVEASFLNDAYQQNYNIEGIYDTTLAVKAQDNREMIFSVKLEVREKENEESIELNFFEKIWFNIVSFFNNIWQSIKSIFSF